MLKKTWAIAAIIGLVLTSCQKKETTVNTNEAIDSTAVATQGVENENVVTKTLTNADGKKLDMSFDNVAGTATVIFDGETILLNTQKPASGIWYKNDKYELSGKGEDVELKKDGKVVFTHKGEKTITNNYKSKDGKELTVNVYNDTETATLVFDGETIDMKSQRPASGVWYKNDHYELRGKGTALTLTKDGKVVFESE